MMDFIMGCTIGVIVGTLIGSMFIITSTMTSIFRDRGEKVFSRRWLSKSIDDRWTIRDAEQKEVNRQRAKEFETRIKIWGWPQ